MNDERKYFTFIWKIKNFNFTYNCQCSYASPVFFVQAICETKWSLLILPRASDYQSSVFCNLNRQFKDAGPHQIEIDYELSFLSAEGSIICSELALNKTFEPGTFGKVPLGAKIEDLYKNLKGLFLPKNTLTIRCRMWKSKEAIANSVICSVKTKVDTQCISFTGTIKQFSNIKPGSVKIISKQSPSESYIFHMNLCVNDDGKLEIEIKSLYSNNYEFKLFILDAFTNKVKACQGENYRTKSIRIPSNFSKEYIMENKELFLLKDTLTLECEVTYCLDCNSSYDPDIYKIVYEYLFQDTQAVITEKPNANSSSEKKHVKSFETLQDNSKATVRNSLEGNLTDVTTLKDDLISLFNEGALCDTKLKTVTEIFAAHSAVLGARSSVFKSMFSTDISETTSKCVNIDDLDAETVRKMLLFMYSDTLDNLDFEKAKSLYFAADKYEISSLKLKCSNILKEKLLYSNCCDVLLFTEQHQDQDLRKCVEDCIAKNDEAVFSSDEWKYLEDNHPRLTTAVFRAVYMKNRKN